MKAFRLSKLFTILWGLVGLWILIGGTILSFYINNNQWTGFLFLAGMLVIICLMVADRATKKWEYSVLDLALRGILVLMIIIVPLGIGILSLAVRPYMITFVAVLLILLVLLGFKLRKAEKISPDQ